MDPQFGVFNLFTALGCAAILLFLALPRLVLALGLLGQRLLAAAGAIALPAWASPGGAGLARDLGLALLPLLGNLIGAAVMALGLALGLVRSLPEAGLWHPAITAVLRYTVDDEEAQRALGYAVSKNDVSAARLALALGADARFAARDFGYLEAGVDRPMLELLRSAGADPDGMPHQTPPLLLAWGNGDLDVFEWLLDAGADPDPPGQVRLLDHILEARRPEAGVPPNDPRWLLALFEHGVDRDQRAPDGTTLLDRIWLDDPASPLLEPLRAAGGRGLLQPGSGTAAALDEPALQLLRRWLGACRHPAAGGAVPILAVANEVYCPWLVADSIVITARRQDDWLAAEISGADDRYGAGPTVSFVALLQPDAATTGGWRLTGLWPDPRTAR